MYPSREEPEEFLKSKRCLKLRPFSILLSSLHRVKWRLVCLLPPQPQTFKLCACSLLQLALSTCSVSRESSLYCVQSALRKPREYTAWVIEPQLKAKGHTAACLLLGHGGTLWSSHYQGSKALWWLFSIVTEQSTFGDAALSWAPFGRAAFPLLVVIRTPAGFSVNSIEQWWVKDSPSSHSLLFHFVQLGLLYCSIVHQLSHFMAFCCHLNQRAALFVPFMNLECKELGHFSNYTIPFLHLLSTNILKWSSLL